MAKSQNPVGKAVVWVILLLLIVGLAGFGATSFGGSAQSVGSVGDTEIAIDRFARSLNQQIRAREAETGERLSIREARAMGLDRAVLDQLVSLAALEDEAAELGISVGDGEIAAQLRSVPAFQGPDGEFDREAYTFALRQQGLDAAEYEEQLRTETARALYQGALVSGIAPPGLFVDLLFDFARETRDITAIRFGAGDLADPIPAPTDAQIEAFYAANPDLFTLPERKRVTYAYATPDTVTDAVEIGDEAVRSLYDERAEQYNSPERRLVERLIFPDGEAARAAADALAAGETDFDALVAERGLTLADIDLGAVSRSDLGGAADAVFALENSEVSDVTGTDLGPALFRVNAVLNAQQIPFEEVEEELRAEAASAAAARRLQAEIDPLEDLLAGGATLEELADETLLTIGETTWSADEAGLDRGAIDAYAAFRTAAEAAEPGDFPELVELADGGLLALRVDEILPSSVRPLDEVEARVIGAWEAAERQARLVARAEDALERLRDGAILDEIGGTVDRRAGVFRDGFLESLPPAAPAEAFALDLGGMTVLPTDTGALILRVDAINAPDANTEEAQAIKRGVEQAAGQGIAEDIVQSISRALEAEKGISLNQPAINAVLTSLN